MRKTSRKNGLFGPNDFISDLKNRGVYQLFIAGMLILGLAAVGLFVYFFAVPLLARDFKQEDGLTVIRQNQNDGKEPVQRDDLYELAGEYLFKIRYVNQPYINGDEIICSGGIDTAGNPLLVRIYLYKISGDGNLSMTDLEIKSKNDNIFSPQADENVIVYTDVKKNGGGEIIVYDRKTKKTKTVKEFFGATPKIHLCNGRIVWFEQVTGDIASVYVYDIEAGRTAAVNTQYGLPFVYGDIGVDGDRIIWTGLTDTDKTIDDMLSTGKSMLFIMDLKTGTVEKYAPEMFAFSPQINGEVLGWIDTNGSPSASLYIASFGSEKKKIASSVTGYYIGDGVVVYCMEQRMYCYFVEKDLTLPLSKEDKKTMMIGGNNGTVFWYDITQKYERDIVKHAKVDKNSWQK